MRILVIKYGGLGDTLTIIPALNLLKKNLEVQIEISINPFYKELTETFADTVSEFNISSFNEKNFDKYDHIFCLISSIKSTLYKTIMKFSCRNIFYIDISECEAKIESVYSFIIEKMFTALNIKTPEMSDQTDFYPLIQPLDKKIYLSGRNAMGKARSKIILPEKKEFSAIEEENYKKKYLLHPGSGGKKKNLSPDELESVIKKIAITPLNTDILIGPAEYGDEFIRKKFRGFRIFENIMDFSVLISIIKNHDFYIGYDSGISHLAALCGVEGIVFFKIDNSEIWKPFSKKFIIEHK